MAGDVGDRRPGRGRRQRPATTSPSTTSACRCSSCAAPTARSAASTTPASTAARPSCATSADRHAACAASTTRGRTRSTAARSCRSPTNATSSTSTGRSAACRERAATRSPASCSSTVTSHAPPLRDVARPRRRHARTIPGREPARGVPGVAHRAVQLEGDRRGVPRGVPLPPHPLPRRGERARQPRRRDGPVPQRPQPDDHAVLEAARSNGWAWPDGTTGASTTTAPFPAIDTVPAMVDCTSTAVSLFPNAIIPLGAIGFPINLFWPIDQHTTRARLDLLRPAAGRRRPLRSRRPARAVAATPRAATTRSWPRTR